MKVKMLVSIASAEWSYAPGDIAEFDDDTATKFVGNGFAEFIEKPPKKRGAKNADKA